MRILIVDDEKSQIESLKRGLRIKGYSVYGTVDPKEALKYLNNNYAEIEIIITDYAMPGMNGIELLKEIRRKNSTLPVIMMTAYGEKQLVIDALRNRCTSFIEKPFTFNELIREIERAQLQLLQNTDSHRLSEMIPRLIHQINNPLMSIIGSAELAMLQLGDAQAVRDRMKNIIQATETIQNINQKIMKIGRGPEEEKITIIDLRQLLGDCVNSFRELMMLKDVTLEMGFYSQSFYLSANRFKLEQALKNIILNAIDAMDGKNKKKLNIKVQKDGGRSSFLICIEDTGCGISEEKMREIFTPYFTAKKGGNGLGLAVSKEVVKQHQGEIRVKSLEGIGTKFEIMLPTNVNGTRSVQIKSSN